MFEIERDLFNTEIDEIIIQREPLYRLRSEFIEYFSIDHVPNMVIEEYVVGLPRLENGLNFCNSIEKDLLGLGNINGSTAFKFGIYFGKTKTERNNEYRFVRRFGQDYEQAFKNIKTEISTLLDNCQNENLENISNCKISQMFKSKIINTYFHNRYLNIHSNDHLDYYLTNLLLDFNNQEDTIYKKERLLEFKNNDTIMENWTIDMFGYFLWSRFPGAPNNGKKAYNYYWECPKG
jgi:hypothetical protein